MSHATPQEDFWAGSFGSEYIDRNKSDQLLAANLTFFGKILQNTAPINSCVEFGANVGMNMRALQLLRPGIQARGVEINPDAAATLRAVIEDSNVVEGSMFDWEGEPADLAFTKGVLIHINPDMLPTAYDRLYQASSRYIMVGEYYNPSPQAIPYRGHTDRLFKRDFAGDLLDRFSDLQLVDYGFAYHRDPQFAQDDISWFLMEKRS